MSGNLTAVLSEKKNMILKFLDSFLNRREAELHRFYPPNPAWNLSWRLRLRNFLEKGKMIRGGLLLLIEEFYREENTSSAPAAGAAMELLQAGLLIHDDIMDRDTLRRGAPSPYHQYHLLVKENGGKDPEHTGVSLGMCLGDMAFFLAFQAVSDIPRLTSFISREIALTCLAQMGDVMNGSLKKPVPRDEIHRLYACKTGRYTFSLPMICGAVLGEAPEPDIGILSKLGEDLGIMFQLKDDEIGLFGDPGESGKPADSDIAEGKITCLMSAVLRLADPAAGERILRVLSGGDPSREDGDFIRRTAEKTGALDETRSIMNEYAERAEQRISELRISAPGESFLRELIRYNMDRRS